MSSYKLIVGLGNPGGDYESTRHNLGYLAVQRLAEGLRWKFAASPLCKGLTAEGTFEGSGCCLLLPLTFMNNSGLAVRDLVAKKNIVLSDMLVVVDDFNLDFGQLRLRRGGSDGGHNGLKSLIAHLGSEDFPRLRMGIGAPADKSKVVDFVLERFPPAQKKQLDGFLTDGAACCETWLREGQDISRVMSQFNKRKVNE